MKSPYLGWIAAFAVFGACSGLLALEDEPPAEKSDFSAPLEEIRELLKPLESDSAEVKEAKTRLRSYPDQLQRMIEQGQWSQFTSESGQLLFDPRDPIPGLAEKLDSLSALVRKEQAARDQAEIGKAESLLARVAQELKTAKKAEDLDELLTELSLYRNDGYSSSPRIAALHRSLQGALQIVGNWQEYLIAEEAGDFRTSRNSLEQISSRLSSNPIIPRSHVLRLLNPTSQKRAGADGGRAQDQVPSLDGIIARLAETGDSSAALAELKAIPKAALVDSNGASFLRAVESIETLRRLEPTMSEAEVFANVRTTASNSQQQDRFTLNLAIDQIALNAIARNHGIEVPSARTTSARNALEGIATKALDQRNWPALRKAIHSLDQLAGAFYTNESVKRIHDLKIIALLELGEAAAARQDFEAAASAYFEATGIDGYYVQREIPYERLADLKQKDPVKINAILGKAEENRRRAEADLHAAEVEARTRVTMSRGFPGERKSDQEMAVLRSVVREVVAEFLREKRSMPPTPAAGDGKPAGPAESVPKDSGQRESGVSPRSLTE